ncbi:hypothetical protein C1H46_008229 [Malus baccata]|uniref:Protein kinase domain-containing protein n=1 Tax=Malus baccata TaxID=106549 RepID=A0A540N557_MALBA|nr:hypothetical protein C1H46_008229 [Malus baccata]
MGNCWTSPHDPHRNKYIPSTPGTSGNHSKNISSNTSSSGGRSQFSEASSSPRIKELHSQQPNGQILESPNLRVFTFSELKAATRNFKSDQVLGEGGFGRVFKGWVDEKTLQPSKSGTGMLVAIKKLNPESVQGVTPIIFLVDKIELWGIAGHLLMILIATNTYLQLQHALTWVASFSLIRSSKFIFRCMLGTSGNHSKNISSNTSSSGGRSQFSEASSSPRIKELHSQQPNGQILESPNLRVFTFSELKAATRNFKSDQVLGEGGFGRVFKGWVDEKTLQPSKSGTGMLVAIKKLNPESVQGYQEWQSFNSKISDFGLAKLGPAGAESHVTTRIMGTYGYAAPEYIATGHLYVKSDVYGFGVVLLEILTGLRALDRQRPIEQQQLAEWAKPLLLHKRKLKNILDVRMEGQYAFKAVMQVALIAHKCLEPDPKSRPSMKEVVERLEQIQAIKEQPKQSKLTSVQATFNFGANKQSLPH